MPAVEEFKEQYPDQWVAIEVTRSRGAEPLEGRLIDHDADHETLSERVKLSKDKDIAVFFTGPLVPEGWAIIL